MLDPERVFPSVLKCCGFVFQKCFEHKPRIISKRNKDNSSTCSHPAMHNFEDSKYVLSRLGSVLCLPAVVPCS